MKIGRELNVIWIEIEGNFEIEKKFESNLNGKWKGFEWKFNGKMRLAMNWILINVQSNLNWMEIEWKLNENWSGLT